MLLPRRIKRQAKLAPRKVVTAGLVRLEKNGHAAAVKHQLATASLTARPTNRNQSKLEAQMRRRMPAPSRVVATAMQTITMEKIVDGVGDEGPGAAKDATAKKVATAMTAATTGTIAKSVATAVTAATTGTIAKIVATGVTPAGKTTDRTDQPSTCPHANGLRSSWMRQN
jgi:hypothetical protein